MSRYIDADLLKTDYYALPKSLSNLTVNTQYVSLFQILNAPTADVVEVVRCKNCRWGKEACGNIECNADLNVPPEYHGYDWFCADGERRNDAEIH